MKTINKRALAKYLKKHLLKRFEDYYFDEALYTADLLLEFHKDINQPEIAKKYLEISVLIQLLDCHGYAWNIEETKRLAGKELVSEMSELFAFYNRRVKVLNKVVFKYYERRKKFDCLGHSELGKIYYKKFWENFRRLYTKQKINLKREVRFEDLTNRASVGGDKKLFLDCWTYSFAFIDSPSCGISLTANISVIEELLKFDSSNSLAWQMIDSAFDVLKLGFPMDQSFDFTRSWLSDSFELCIEHRRWELAIKGLKTLISLGKVDLIDSLSTTLIKDINNIEHEITTLVKLLTPYFDAHNNWCEDIAFHFAREQKNLTKALEWNQKIIQADHRVDTLKNYIFEQDDKELKKNSDLIYKIVEHLDHDHLIYENLDQVIDELWKMVKR